MLYMATRKLFFAPARVVMATAVLEPLLLAASISMLGQSAPFYICFFLFTILGFGFRVGTGAMWLCQASAIASFCTVVLISPTWKQYPIFAASFLLLLIVVPLYATILIKKLRTARALAEYESRRLAAALQSAEEANQAKRRFVSSISHELRTPLNAIIGMADLLESTSLAPDQKDMVDSMENASRSMLSLIEDVLDFSKIEAGKLVIENTELDLYQLVDETADIFKYQTLERGLTLTTHIDRDIPWALRGDPRQLRQVLVNLLSNAVKFTHAGSITLKVHSLAATDHEIALRFEIEDTGIGIPVESQTKIFESFTQADESTGDRYGGTGLGTTISKQLVELMGGKLGLRSEPGVGSTFWFELRLQKQTGNPQRQSSRKTAEHVFGPSGKKRNGQYSVLVAEDNPVNAKVIRKILERSGHRCVVVENGRDALDQLRRQNFDAVILDMNMPVMNGLDTAKEYREKWPAEPHVPIIMFSASVTKEVRAECLTSGIDEFLPKPIQVDSLLSTLDRLITQFSLHNHGGQFRKAQQLAETAPVVDRTALITLGQLGDHAFVEDLLATFITDNQNRLTRLRESLAESRFDDFRKSVHALMGSAATMGATALKEACQRVEPLSPAELERDAEQILANLGIAFERFRRTLEEYRVQPREDAPDHHGTVRHES
jgi:two-component system sensor histidine kinase RpfC